MRMVGVLVEGAMFVFRLVEMLFLKSDFLSIFFRFFSMKIFW